LRRAKINGLDWKVNISPNINDNGKVIFVVKNRIVKPEPKKLDEARGLVTADYQAYLEKLWIQELRNKYKVEVDQELLAKIRNN
jgi:peptidyl-prolyl cis-trans isomerase SurA